jgi:uncharacterized protein (TIGR02099 family)
LNAAVLVTVIRIALPEIGGYKNEIQSWVSEYMDYPVVIDEITAEWQGWAPHLYLKNIDLYTPDHKTLISRFESAHLGIDPFASLNKRELVPSQLSVSGVNLEFTRNIDGSISINNNNNLDAGSNNSAMSGWLLKQKHIKLENTSLIWHDKKENKDRLEFSNAQLELKTHKERIQIDANITLPEHHGQSLTLKMDVFGNILTPDWKGSIYLEAKDVNPEKLLEDFPIKSSGGIGNAKIWTNWGKAKLMNISSEISYSNFSLIAEQHSLPIENISVDFYGERKEEKDWTFNIKVEDLKTKNGFWPTSNFQLNIVKKLSNKQYSGQLSYLKLEEVIPFLVATKLIPAETLASLDWQSLKGELKSIDFYYDPESTSGDILSLNTSFNGLELVSANKQYSASGLAGSIGATNNKVKLDVNSISSVIHLGSIYDEPISLSDFRAELELTNRNSFELLIKDFYISDNFISAKSSGKLSFSEGKSPYVDVVTHINETSIEYLPKYLPEHSSENLKKWFTTAMVGGQLLSGDLIFHGYAADFPFDNSEGNFKAIFNVENTIINYAEGWPPVDQITAEVIIDNDDLYISSNSAYMFDASISDLKVNLKKLSVEHPTVIVHGKVAGHTSDAANFIKQSPLNEKKSLRELTENISGGINLKLGLDIPLGPGHTSIDGLITFTDTTIESNLPGLGLEGVNGDVYFTGEATWANDIDALYHGAPVTLNIPKFEQHELDSESYVISGVADKDFFITELTSFFPSLLDSSQIFSKKLSGESKWSLTLTKSSDSSEGREVEFNTDLRGIAVDLPYPLGKSETERSPLSIKTSLTSLLIDEIKISYNDIIYADFAVDNKDDLSVKTILIGLGNPHPATATQSEISIQGEIDKFNAGDWIDFINPENSVYPNINNKQKTISGKLFVKQLNMIGNEFNNVNINLSNPKNGWQIFFDGDEIKGNTNIVASENNRLHAKFEKLTLKTSDNAEGENKNKIAIDKIPELDVNVDEFIFNKNELGQLSLLTSNVKDGININNLSITKPGLIINATGEWTCIDEVDRSDFQAKLKADTIETMLSTFSFDTTNIKDGQTEIDMNAYWMDTPMNFAMEKIDGELDIKIDKGQFLDIDPSAGRLFGLLSIQTLPRRLTLDFTDIFDEGFAFDNITGNFSVQKGHAYTNNLEMTGPAADIIVSGRTGLSTEDYDQIATVTPKISSNLPVASALFGPVGIGVGAVIYLAGEIFEAIPKKIDQILKLQYTITGSWDHPNIEKIKKEKNNS